MTDIQDIQIGASPELPLAETRILGASCKEATAIAFDPRTLPAAEKCPARSGPLAVLILADGPHGRLADVMAKEALKGGHRVTMVTAVDRPLPAGVAKLIADRDADDFSLAIAPILRDKEDAPAFQLLIDCGATQPRHARQDLEELALPKTHIVFVSNDLVYAPKHRGFPTTPDNEFICDPDSPWSALRQAEAEFLQNTLSTEITWTILRPTLTLIDGESLDDFPPFVHRVNALRQERGVPMLSGGHFLVQPIAATDLARIALATPSVPKSHGIAIDCAGPVPLEFQQLCELASHLLGKSFQILELPETGLFENHPEYAPYSCHRLYPLPWKYAPLPAPMTAPADALRAICL